MTPPERRAPAAASGSPRAIASGGSRTEQELPPAARFAALRLPPARRRATPRYIPPRMDAPRPIPFQAAAARAAGAYGLRQGAPATQKGRVEDGRIVAPFEDRGPATRTDHVELSLGTLVSGRVESPIGRGEGFDQPAPARMAPAPVRLSSNGSFAMYTRAADRLEVATSVALGRSLDLKA